MSTLIVVYSFTGNNRLVAGHLGDLLNAPVAEVDEGRRRWQFSIALDLFLNRRPQARQLQIQGGAAVGDFDHVLFVSPVWDLRLASPMVATLRQLRGQVCACSLVTACGYDRPGQAAALADEMTRELGLAPQFVMQLLVGNLYPPKDRHRISKVSAHRLQSAELAQFACEFKELVERFGGPPLSPDARNSG